MGAGGAGRRQCGEGGGGGLRVQTVDGGEVGAPRAGVLGALTPPGGVAGPWLGRPSTPAGIKLLLQRAGAGLHGGRDARARPAPGAAAG